MYYDNPINLITKQINDETEKIIENRVVEVLQEFDIEIDKEKLIEALNQDRHRYGEAYKKGYNDAFEEIKQLIETRSF